MTPARPSERSTIASFMPSADQRNEIHYPGGHVVRINRQHVLRVLAVKAERQAA